ncbi:hypothetical protein PHYC_01117 [Phycisphaerales bacterium]|nr:hypothetical protein PHYC_01117 [Phycisphaerales bacterium]
MIRGIVNESLEAMIDIDVLGAGGRLSVAAVIDTGFTGFVTLPRETISALGLTFVAESEATLATGQVAVLRAYRARVSWPAGVFDVLVLESDTAPLVGMSLLRGLTVRITVVAGGDVILTEA